MEQKLIISTKKKHTTPKNSNSALTVTKHKWHLRPEILHCVKLGNQSQVFRPAFALIIFEIPKSPSAERIQWRLKKANKQSLNIYSRQTFKLLLTKEDHRIFNQIMYTLENSCCSRYIHKSSTFIQTERGIKT